MRIIKGILRYVGYREKKEPNSFEHHFYYELNTYPSTITFIVMDQLMYRHTLLKLSTKPLHEDNVSSC